MEKLLSKGKQDKVPLLKVRLEKAPLPEVIRTHEKWLLQRGRILAFKELLRDPIQRSTQIAAVVLRPGVLQKVLKVDRKVLPLQDPEDLLGAIKL